MLLTLMVAWGAWSAVWLLCALAALVNDLRSDPA